MVYDCFPFFNELDLLKLRLHVLNDVVDRFVISEATVTHSGNVKPLFFEENKSIFKEFEHKIIHLVIEDTPDVDSFGRDEFQKCAVKRGLVNCHDDDIIIFSDLDEIPNPKKIKEILSNFNEDKIYHFAQRNFYCYINNEEVSGNLLSFTGEFENIRKKKWLGTSLCGYSLLKSRTTGSLRNPDTKEIGVRVDDGGWHFTYMGGDRNTSAEERIRLKLQSFCHQEYNSGKVFSKLAQRISSSKDVLGRRNTKYRIVPIDESYPEYLLKNIDEYRYLLKHK